MTQTQRQPTPGPWHLWPNNSNRSPVVCVGDTSLTLQGIATINGMGPETEANAALICAAPALLAALKGLLDCVPPKQQDGPRAIAAREAIALAEGGK